MALTDKLCALGDAIRTKNGETHKYTLDEMAQKIHAIEIGGSSILPSEYQEISYLQSDGTQYIMTDYYPNGYTQILAHSYNIDDGYLYGERDGNNLISFSLYKILSGGAGSIRFGSQSILCTSTTYTKTIHGYNASDNTASFSIIDAFGGTLIKSGNYNLEEFIAARPLVILNCSINGTVDSNAAGGLAGNLYRLTIKEKDIPVRDFVPCYRKKDEKPGLFDIVNKRFYINAGEGEFSFFEKL